MFAVQPLSSTIPFEGVVVDPSALNSRPTRAVIRIRPRSRVEGHAGLGMHEGGPAVGVGASALPNSPPLGQLGVCAESERGSANLCEELVPETA